MGKNLAIRFPGKIMKAIGLSDGEKPGIETREGAIIVRGPAPRFTLKELFRGKSPKRWRATYAGAFDWGPDVGREIVNG